MRKLSFVAVILSVGLIAACAGDGGDAQSPDRTAEDVAEAPEPAEPRASSYIGGNASPSLPTGEQGDVVVIKVGPYPGQESPTRGSLPLIVRNNTAEVVTQVSVSATARDSSDELIASGEDQRFHPDVVEPGEIAIGFIFFGPDVPLPEDASFEFHVTHEPASDDEFNNFRDLVVAEVSKPDSRIVGTLQMSTTSW